MKVLNISPFNGTAAKLFILAAVFIIIGCKHSEEAIEDNQLSLNPSSSYLLAGEEIYLKSCWEGEKDDARKINFTASKGELTHISNPPIKTIDNSSDNGLIYSICSTASFMSKQPGKYHVKAMYGKHHASANLIVVNSDDTILNLLPAVANLGPDSQPVTLEGFVTNSTGEPMIGAPVLFTFSSDSTYTKPVLMRTDKQGNVQLKFKSVRDTQVCFFLMHFTASDMQCSKASTTDKLGYAQSQVNIERPTITQILPLSVPYREGQIYYLTLIGEGFEEGALAWVSNTPAEVVLATRYRLLIRFPGPEKVVTLGAGGETIHVFNPKSGYSVKKSGFNFSGKL
jgi:hypothetical protein